MSRILLGTAFLLASCAIAPNSSGVFKSQPGIFTVTSNTEFGGVSSARGDALERATKACAARGKQLNILDERTDGTANAGSKSAYVSMSVRSMGRIFIIHLA